MKEELDGLSDTLGYQAEIKQKNEEEEVKSSIEIKRK